MKFQIVRESKNPDKMGTDITIQDVDRGQGHFVYFVDFKMGSGDVVKLVKRIIDDLNFEIGAEIKIIKKLSQNS